MLPQRFDLTVTTDALGDAVAFTDIFSGPIYSIVYVKDDYDTGVDFTITLEATGQGVWTEVNVDADKTVAPRQPTHGQDGTASLYAGAGEPVEDLIMAAHDRIKIVIANGGNATSGTFHLTVGAAQ